MNATASNYKSINIQEIFCEPNGTIRFFNNNFLKLNAGENIFLCHPFFESIEEILLQNPNEIQTYPCVHLGLDEEEFICDINITVEEHQLTVVVLDYTDAYLNLNEIAQERNESVINSQLLILKNQQLEKEKEFKNKFLANISHEIRSPLNAIVGFSELLSNTSLSMEQSELLQVIHKANDQLTAIINDMLDIAKIEMGEIHIKKEEFSLKDLILQLTKIYSKKAENKFLTFKVDYDESIREKIIGDQVRVQQILENLIQNAIKYTVSGHVILKVEKSFSRANKLGINFKIEDTGAGIPEDKINQIFDSFFQLANNAKNKGTGLGLTITKNLIEILDGKITVESILAKGTTVNVYLPFRFNILESSKKVSSKTYKKNQGFDGKKSNILLVENNEISQLLVMKTLINHGSFHIDIAPTGEKALQYISLRDYDVILMDLMMPGMNGFETTAAIRNFEDKTLRKIPIIALTGFATKEQRKACLDAGMNDYITKPFKQEELIATLEKLYLKNKE